MAYCWELGVFYLCLTFANIFCFTPYRQPRHDMRSVENIVSNYLRQKSALSGQRGQGGRGRGQKRRR